MDATVMFVLHRDVQRVKKLVAISTA